MPAESPAAIEVFFSYSHEDEALRDELSRHVSLLKRQGVIAEWHDRRIGAGQEWANEIDRHIDSADIILLLVSSDFLASNYCWDVEVRRAMTRHEAGEARVVPVILRPVDWRRAPFGKLQALPTDARPVTSWPNRDEAFLDVAEGIRRETDARLRHRVEHFLDKLGRAESLRNWPNVIELGRRILAVLPHDEALRARIAAAHAARWSGRIDRAMDNLARISIKRKRNEDYNAFLGILESIQDDMDRAIELDPGHGEYYFLRGSVNRFASFNRFRLRRTFIDDRQDFEDAARRNPECAEYHFALGWSTSGARAAQVHFRRAIELGYDEATTRHDMAQRLEWDGDLEAAFPEYRRAAALGHRMAGLRLRRLQGEQPELYERLRQRHGH